jgi:hypothetical protein
VSEEFANAIAQPMISGHGSERNIITGMRPPAYENVTGARASANESVVSFVPGDKAASAELIGISFRQGG